MKKNKILYIITVPDPPESIGVKSKGKTIIIFTWKAPKYPNGNIKLYISYFQRVEAAYFVPHKCSPISNDPTARETAGFELNISALLPYTTYSVQVAAQNDYGLGEYSAPYMVNTDPSSKLKTHYYLTLSYSSAFCSFRACCQFESCTTRALCISRRV